MKSYLLATVYFLSLFSLQAQTEVVSGEQVHLDSLIRMAIRQSSAALQAETLKENKYWRWRTFKSDFNPQLALEGVIPEFNRSISPIIQDDGNVAFQEISNSNAYANLSLSQAVGLTGGTIFVNSQLQRFDDLSNHSHMYNGNPGVIGLRQPLFTYNGMLWSKRIEPLLFEESKKEFVEDMEEIAFTTAQYFFELLTEQENLAIALKNQANNDTIYKISEKKYELGKISKGELLQLRLAVLNSQKAAAQAKLAFENAKQLLNVYVGIDLVSPRLIVPENIPQFYLDKELALVQAKKNRQDALSFERLALEAKRDVAKAKGENGINANLVATLGFSNMAPSISKIYESPNDQQTVRLAFNIPILDWGRSTSRLKTAQANEKLVNYVIAQEIKNFEQEIYMLVNQFETLRSQLKITAEADQIAEERYTIYKNRYLIGELQLTDLNIAQQEKDQAKRDFIMALRAFWEAHYSLRLLTLYDFEKNETIEYESINTL